MDLRQQVIDAFSGGFGAPPRYIVRSPGRVNLIGEHTDYNDGFVLPVAIDKSIWIGLRPRPDHQVILRSLNFDETAIFDLDDYRHEGGWIEYVKGVAWALQERTHSLSGWEGVVVGDVPVGAGLSSSAALEMAAARAFAAVADLPWDPASMAIIGQYAENEWVGVKSGVMDQMISAVGRHGHALLIDCRSLDTELAPLPPETAVVVLDTNTRRGLLDSAYNERQSQCEAAAAFFGVPALRDLDMAAFMAKTSSLNELIQRRARHVISENERTQQAASAMRQGNAVEFGRLMNDSHESLRHDFEVSSLELDVMVEKARQQAGCYGARMTGAGFGGCAVALVQADEVESFMEAVREAYQAETGITPVIYSCVASDGASLSECE